MDRLLYVRAVVDVYMADERIPADLRRRADEVCETGVRESVGFVRTAVGRLGRIIDALLRLSRAGRVVYQPQHLDVATIARRVVDLIGAPPADTPAGQTDFLLTSGKAPNAALAAGISRFGFRQTSPARPARFDSRPPSL